MLARIFEISQYVYGSARHKTLVTRLTKTKSKSVLRAELYSLKTAITTGIFEPDNQYDKLDTLQMYLTEIIMYIKQLE